MKSEVKNAMKVVPNFVNGILGKKQSKYDLKFVEDDGYWYIDMPWPGDRHNLMMVSGADYLCEYLSYDGRHTDVEVICRKEKDEDLLADGYAEMEQIEWSWAGGSTYRVHNAPKFRRKVWICPVTLTVLGRYPHYIYLKRNR